MPRPTEIPEDRMRQSLNNRYNPTHVKKDGGGRSNWGSVGDEISEGIQEFEQEESLGRKPRRNSNEKIVLQNNE